MVAGERCSVIEPEAVAHVVGSEEARTVAVQQALLA
jgi:hypothetical protein